MGNNRIPLESDNFYHIFNHAIGKENLFLSCDNYEFFLNKYSLHIEPIADTLAYCLMPNHFHFIVRIKESPIDISSEAYPAFSEFDNLKRESLYLSHIFGNLFNSYTKAFNKQQKRRGKLFLDNFVRIQIDSGKYLKNVIQYVHYNPIHHGFSNSLTEWKFSSFNSFLLNNDTFIKRNEVLELFDNLEGFLQFHGHEIDKDLISKLET
jgi:REP element-mobilizing transposase RayT